MNKTFRKGSGAASLRVVFTLLVGALTACQPDPADRVARAAAHMSAGDYRAAVLESRSALQDAPANVEARLIFAEASRRVGDYRTAAAEFGRAVELGADVNTFVEGYAESLLVTGRANQVVEALADRLAGTPETASKRTLLGHAFASRGEVELARTEYERALALDAATADAYVGLASIAERAGDNERLEQWLTTAKTRVPDSPELLLFLAQQETDPAARAPLVDRAYTNLGPDASPVTRAQVLLVRVENDLQRKDLDRAEATLDEYRELFPGAPQTLFLRSLIALERGDIDRARNGLLRISEGVADGSPADLFLGGINLQQSNLRQAEAYLTKALRFDATSVAARKLLAETLLQLNRPREALEVLSSLAPDQTRDAQVLALLGRAAVASGNPADGVAFFERSAAEMPDDPGLQLATAYSYLAAGDAQAALRLLENIEDNAAGGYRGALLRMLAHLSTNDRAAAIAEAESLVARNPDDASAWSLAGQLMGNLREVPIARQYYRRALQIDSEHVPSRYGLARVELVDGKLQEAQRLLAALLDDKPDYMPAVAAFGQIAQTTGDTSAALARVQAAVEAAPEASEPRFLLAQYQLLAGDLEAALTTAEIGLEANPDNPRLLQMRGKARGRLGNEEAARKDLLRAADLAPTDRLMQLDKARVLLNTNNRQGARRVVAEYLELRPGDTVAQLFGADLDLGAGLIDRAAVVVREVLQREPDNRTALILQGDILARRGDLRGALARFELAGSKQMDRGVLLRQFSARQQLGLSDSLALLEAWLRDNPNDVQVQTVLAQSLDSSGDRDAAIALYEQLASNKDAEETSRAIVLNNLAWMYFSVGDARARATADEARRLLPDSAAINDTLGWIAFSDGDLDTAIAALRRANELDSRDPEIASHYAAALARNGEREQALRLLRRALEDDASFNGREAAEALLAELQNGG